MTILTPTTAGQAVAVLTPLSVAATGMGPATAADYGAYVARMDGHLQQLCMSGAAPAVRFVDADKFRQWCDATGRDFADQQAANEWPVGVGATFQYDGSLWDLVLAQQVAMDASRAALRAGGDVAHFLDSLADPAEELMRSAEVLCAGANGLLQVTAWRGPGASLNGALSTTEITCDVDLVGGSCKDARPSRTFLLQAVIMLGHANGGRVDLHTYAPDDKVQSVTFWLPWGVGKTCSAQCLDA